MMGVRIVKPFVLALALFGGSALISHAGDHGEEYQPQLVDPAFANAPIPGPDGQWRDFVQLLWVADDNRLARVQLRLYDPLAAENYQLTWQPTGPVDLAALNAGDWGKGRLVWRRSGSRPYDRTAVQAMYEGRIVDGYFTGAGRYVSRAGVQYQGDWLNGVMHGQGVLHRPNGDRFEGRFVNGRAEGGGVLRTVFGEFFKGEFRAGQRHGPGHLTLVDGRAFRSVWHAGREDISQRVWDEPPEGFEPKLAQSSNQTPLRFGVAVDRNLPPDALQGIYKPYDSRFEGSVLKVFPADQNFVDQWRGDAVLVAQDPSLFGIMDAHLPANFVMSLENTDARPLQVVSGFLAVQSSETDREPFIELVRQMECGQRTLTTVYMRNFGISQPVGARLSGGPISVDGTRYLATVNVDQVEGWPRAEVDFAGTLPQLGPEIAALGQADLACPSGNYEQCLIASKAAGVLGPLADGVYLKRNALTVDYSGELSYSWADNSGQLRTKTSQVRFPIKIGQFALPAECGEGSDAPRAFPNPFVLPLDQQNYRLPFAFPATLAPGQLSSWTFQIDSAASSRHVFQMVLELSDGRQVASQVIDLTYFKPEDIWRMR